jgi:hypothetical protein
LLIVRLVELLIVIVPVVGVLYGGFKAVSKAANAPARSRRPMRRSRSDRTSRPSGMPSSAR